VQGAGCRVQGAGCRVQGAGCRVQGAGQADGNPLDLWRKKLHSNPGNALLMSEVAEFFAWVILVQESNRSFTCHLGSSA